MSGRAKFDGNDPFDAIAQMTKSIVAAAFAEAMSKSSEISTDQALQYEALLAGLLVGAYGCLISMTHPEMHGDLRAALISSLPDAFDQARDVIGLPRLGALS